MTRPDEPAPLSPALVEALRADSKRALDGFDDSAFADAVMGRVDAAVAEGQSQGAIDEAVRASLQQAVVSQDAAFAGFADEVDRRVDGLARADVWRSPADRAIDALQDDVAAELDAVAPRFERDFAAGIQDRLARPAPGRFDRLRVAVRHWLAGVGAPLRFGIGGLAAGAVAAALLVVFQPAPPASNPALNVPGAPQTALLGAQPLTPSGEITVDDIAFEGTVTVMNEGAIAVVWLSDVS